MIPLSTGRPGQIGLILPLPGASLRTVMTDSSIPDMMAEARRGQWTDQQLAAKAVELAEFILKQSNAGMRGKEKRQAQQMERMMNELNSRFVQINRANIVNIEYIRSIRRV